MSVFLWVLNVKTRELRINYLENTFRDESSKGVPVSAIDGRKDIFSVRLAREGRGFKFVKCSPSIAFKTPSQPSRSRPSRSTKQVEVDLSENNSAIVIARQGEYQLALTTSPSCKRTKT